MDFDFRVLLSVIVVCVVVLVGFYVSVSDDSVEKVSLPGLVWVGYESPFMGDNTKVNCGFVCVDGSGVGGDELRVEVVIGLDEEYSKVLQRGSYSGGGDGGSVDEDSSEYDYVVYGTITSLDNPEVVWENKPENVGLELVDEPGGLVENKYWTLTFGVEGESLRPRVEEVSVVYVPTGSQIYFADFNYVSPNSYTPFENNPFENKIEVENTGVGDWWVSPLKATVKPDETRYEDEIHCHSGGEDIGSWDVFVTYDNSVISLDETYTGDAGFTGLDDCTGTVQGVSVNLNNFRVGGFASSGIADGVDVHMFDVHWEVRGSGTCSVDVVPVTFTNPDGETIGTPNGIEGKRIVP